MTRRAALLVVLLAALVVLAPAAGALAQDAIESPATAAGPEPLWVPDPEQSTSETEDASSSSTGGGLEVTAPITVASAAADDPSRVAVAHWMAGAARDAGLPGELPVMASLVESGLRNLAYGDADSVGYFQMRLGTWDGGEYAGYLTRPELQLRWFVAHALAVRDARIGAGDAAFGEDPATWGEWIADVEQPYAGYRGRYQPRLDEARLLLALPAPAVAPFELGLTVGGAGSDEADPAGDALAQDVIADPSITLDPRASSDLTAGRVDPRISQVLLAAAASQPLAITVFQTGHPYYVAGTDRASNHSFGRAVDIGSVGGELVSPSNELARALVLAIGRLPEAIRPTEIGSPWAIDEPGYFTDADHQDHLHLGFDDPAGADAAAAAVAAQELEVSRVPVATKRASAPAEPRFDTGGGAGSNAGGGSDPRFEVSP